MVDSVIEPWRPQPPSDGDVGDLALNEWVGQALGSASMCWANVGGAGEFDSVRAAWVLDGLMAHLNAVVDGVIAGTTEAVRAVPAAAGVEPGRLVEALVAVTGPGGHHNGYDGFECTRCGRDWYRDEGMPHLAAQTLRVLGLLPAGGEAKG